MATSQNRIPMSLSFYKQCKVLSFGIVKKVGIMIKSQQSLLSGRHAFPKSLIENSNMQLSLTRIDIHRFSRKFLILVETRYIS
jgi:hypothetical protein